MDLTDITSPQKTEGRPSLVYCPHPLIPSRDREVLYAEVLPKETLEDYLKRHGILERIRHRPVILTIDGHSVPRKMWRYTRPKPGTLISVQAALAGGEGKNPIAAVLSIALLVTAPYMAGWTLTGSWGAITGGPSAFQASLLTAGIGIVGGLAINALFPPPRPNVTQPNFSSPSPTYALTGGSNRARPYEPMPVIMGTHRVYPDYGARPYTEFIGDDQFLFQIFDLGYNNLDLSDFRIGETSIDVFTGVEIEQAGADGKLELFPSNVDTTAGAALEWDTNLQEGIYVQRTSSADAVALAVDITGSLFQVDKQGNIIPNGTRYTIEYSPTGLNAWQPVTYVEDTTTATTKTVGQVRLPTKLYSQHIIAPNLLPGETRTSNGTQKPLRRTYYWRVAKGQYDVRVRLTHNAKVASPLISQAVADLTWSQLRTYQQDNADYTGRCRIALKIKASAQLQGQIEQFNCLAEAKTEIWDGENWVANQKTDNPAWWVLAAMRGVKVNNQLKWGGGIPDTRINLENLKDFGAWCASEGLTFNGVFDQQLSVREMIDAIALRGRGTLSTGSGKHEIVWDAPNQPVVAVIGMSNILRDTFEIEYGTENTADEIVASFANKDMNYARDVVRVVEPGVVTPLRSRSIELFGCDNVVEAAQSANLYMANNLYRTKRYRWRMDWEAMPLSRGEVAQFSHDLASYDYSGRLLEGSTDTVLRLERKVPVDINDPYITIVKPDGTFASHQIVAGVGTSDTITLVSPLTFDPGADPNHPPYDYRWLYGSTSTPGKKVKIEGIKPVSYNTVEVTALDEVPAYYDAKDGDFVHVTPPVFTAAFPTIQNLEVTEELILAGEGFAVKLILTWDVTGTYDHANIRIGVNDSHLELVGSTRDRRFEWVIPDLSGSGGYVDIEVTAVHPVFGTKPGSAATNKHTILGKSVRPGDVQDFTYAFDGPTIVLSWSLVPDVDVTNYIVRRGSDWDTAVEVGTSRTNTLRVPAVVASTDYLIKAEDSSKNRSANAARVTVTPTGASAPVLTAAFDGGDLKLTWPTPALGSYPLKHYEIRYGPTWAGGTHIGFVDVTNFRTIANWSGTRKWWVAAIDTAGIEGTPGSIDVNVTKPSAPNVLAEVIDNNVLLRWDDVEETLPIDHYELRRGDTFATAEVRGTIKSLFAVVFESEAGSYRYWIVGVDSAGNYGTESSVVTSVAAPPDYILYDRLTDDFSGTKTNCLAADGKLLAMVDPVLSYDDSFGNESWNTWQDAIDAGFPQYMHKGETTAQYSREYDLGTVIPATKITVDVATTNVYGSMTITPTISVRETNLDPWTDFVGLWSVYATNFRFVKITLDFAGSGREDLLVVDELTTQLDVKLKSDAGIVTADSGDVGGTTVNFNVPFIDVHAITATAQGTTPAICVVDFTDSPNPTSFKILVFDTAGNRITRDVRWEAKGV